MRRLQKIGKLRDKVQDPEKGCNYALQYKIGPGWAWTPLCTTNQYPPYLQEDS